MLYKLLISGVLTIFSIVTFGQSNAHLKSNWAIIDPAYNTSEIASKNNASSNNDWLYAPSELECWRLQVLRQRTDSAKLRVNYPGQYHIPYNKASFRISLSKNIVDDTLCFKTCGSGELLINEKKRISFSNSKDLHKVYLGALSGINQIQFNIESTNDLPALCVMNTSLSTSNSIWLWRSDEEPWQKAAHFSSNVQNDPPHIIENPVLHLKPVYNNAIKLFDFNKELFGYIFFKSDAMPFYNVGESQEEALDTNNTIKEQSLELIKISDQLWRSKSTLAYRYVCCNHTNENNVWCEALFHPEVYKGAFACSDSLLTQIWMNSAYTLHLCMHDFLLDGVKRDRLPWTGDLVMSLLVNAFTFADKEMVCRTLVALGREGIAEQDINGIADYSLWWIIAQDKYQLYYNDSLHLATEWGKIKKALNQLTSRCDSNGFFNPSADAWVFIDWVNGEKWTSLQILWWWAQQSAVNLANRMDDSVTASYYTQRTEELKRNLTTKAWSNQRKIWWSGDNQEIQRHPNMLALISGLTQSSQPDSILNLLHNKSVSSVGTPYMAGFELLALSEFGNIDKQLDYIRAYWGGMLNCGATTFWEAYNPEDPNHQYSFYGRPYAKSLCHAWSSGPAYLLPAMLFGIEPLNDGWQTIKLNPDFGSLKWVSACIPTNFGDVVFDYEKNQLKVACPKGVTVIWNKKSYSGEFTLEID